FPFIGNGKAIALVADAADRQAVLDAAAKLADAFGVDAAALQESGHLIVNGVDVGLLNYKAWDQGRITIFFDLGSIPMERQAYAYRKLLEQNLLLPRTFGTYAIIPGTGHGALAYTFDFSDGLNGYVLARNICETLKQYKSMEKSLHNASQDSRQRMDSSLKSSLGL
ncbi:MAG: CesT family type III secretion system chaperone, partial [Exilibacterium sp.]